VTDEQTAWAALVTAQLESLNRENVLLWQRLAELGDGMIDLDHKIGGVSRAVAGWEHEYGLLLTREADEE
jgi:hypothetical protein